ncbi:hypothetical protein E1A91_D04G018400v1 [Gossypium mustelinum]|uniref:Secreted protein n=1 Tax=Gossypium mustelinum TaxID=34275 RepID=A0A5D2V8R7_GOSMU|nr:hypothetical protein E1A91_D04G018400v1 [Gossypium mustelinum]
MAITSFPPFLISLQLFSLLDILGAKFGKLRKFGLCSKQTKNYPETKNKQTNKKKGPFIFPNFIIPTTPIFFEFFFSKSENTHFLKLTKQHRKVET